LRYLTDILQKRGYHIRPATGGELAMSAVAAKRPDLILLDVKMPGMDGYEVCRRLKADPENARIPIIFISALDEPEDKVKAFAAGGVDYITKPLHAEEVLARVQTHLRLQELAGRLEQLVVERTAELTDANQKLHEALEARKRDNALINLRLKLMQYAADHSFEALMQTSLDEVEKLTGSNISFYHTIQADQKTIILTAWSTNTIDKFCKTEGLTAHYNIDEAGVWGDCVRERKPVIHNDYESLPHKKGLPDGHVEVVRQLVVPIFRHDRIVSILGVGNKQSDYTREDVQTATYCADVVLEIAERKQAEEALALSEEKYSKAFNNSPVWVVLSDLETGRLIEVNQTFLDDLGYTRDEVIGRPSAEVGGWENPDDRRIILETIKEQGHIHDYEYQRRTRSGKALTMLFSGEVIDIGGQACLLTVSQDITDRYQQERKIRESEKLLKHITANVPGVVYQFCSTLQHEYSMRFVSEKVTEIFGLDPSPDTFCEVFAHCIPESDREAYIASIRAAVDDVTPWYFEGRFIHPTGREMWFSGSSVPHKEGHNVVFDGVLLDITERIETTASLRLNEMRLEAMVELNQMTNADIRQLTDFALEKAIKLTSSEIGYLAFTAEDENILEMYSWSKEASRKCAVENRQNIFEVEDPGFLKEAIRQRRPVITNDHRSSGEDKKGRPEGHVPIFRHMNIPVFDGERIVAVAGVGNKKAPYVESDVNQLTLLMQGMWQLLQRKQADEALRQSEAEQKRVQDEIKQRKQFLELVLNHLPDAIVTLDLERRVVDWNPGAQKMFGYTPEEAIGRSLDELVARDAAFTEAGRKTAQLLSGKAVEPFETVRHHKDGTALNVIAAGSSIMRDDVLTGVVVVYTDISKQRKMEDERKEYEARIQQMQKMEAIGTLAGGIAHDFNNILSGVIGYAELSLAEIPQGTPLHRNLRQILAGGRRAGDLVRQILTFSRQNERELKPLQIGPMLKEALKLMRSSLPVTIEIAKYISPEVDNVMADPTQIHQIIMNLCTNAAQAMDVDGGRLRVELVQEVLEAHDVATQPGIEPGLFARISVEDTGKGIAPEHIGKIFNPYFTTKKTGEGTGLGLAMVHGIVQSYRGFINVDSTPGQGTRFDVFIPTIEAEQLLEVAEEMDLPTGHEHILVVDDEEVLVDVISEMLTYMGYQVTASNGSNEALVKFTAAPADFDLVLTDMTMPDLTGIQLSNRLREIRPDIPIVLCTGYSHQLINRR
ncbi:MAG: PAS domain S-box protein, partial [Desulfobacteraceae bacterium]